MLHALPPEEQAAALNAHPPIGARTGLSARSAAEQGTDDDPEVLVRARAAERRVRVPARLPLRRLRRRTAPAGDPGRAARADRPSDRRGARGRDRRARLDRAGPLAEPLVIAAALDPYVSALVRRDPPLPARRQRDRVDRRLVLLRRARLEAAPAGAPRGRGRGRRRRGVGGARRRLLPRAQVPGRAAGAARGAAVVQVGGVHDVGVGLRAPRRPLLPRRLDLPRRPARRRPDRHARPWRSRSAACCWPGRSTTCCLRFVPDEDVVAGAIVGLTALAAWGAGELFAPRAAWLQVGAMLGTIMAANVFFSIIPAHRGLIAAKEEGLEPDPRPGLDAKRRSVHNNYLTLPVLVTMLAGARAVPLRALACLADPARADGDRRLVPALLQPAPHRPDAVLDPAPRRGGAARARDRARAGRLDAAARPRRSPWPSRPCAGSSTSAASPATPASSAPAGIRLDDDAVLVRACRARADGRLDPARCRSATAPA